MTTKMAIRGLEDHPDKREWKEAVKKAKLKGAVECQDCRDIINDKECLMNLKGKYYHIHCAPFVPTTMVGGRIISLLRVATPGKQKKRDNTAHRRHNPFLRDEYDYDD